MSATELIPVVFILQSPQLLLQAPLPMTILYQALTLCQKGHLLCFNTGPLGLQLFMPVWTRGPEGLQPWQIGTTLWESGSLTPPKHKQYTPAKPQGTTSCQVPLSSLKVGEPRPQQENSSRISMPSRELPLGQTC